MQIVGYINTNKDYLHGQTMKIEFRAYHLLTRPRIFSVELQKNSVQRNPDLTSQECSFKAQAVSQSPVSHSRAPGLIREIIGA